MTTKTFLILGAGFLLFSGCKSKSALPQPGVKIMSQDLFKAYKENRAEAEKKYKGKILEVTGTVDEVGRDVGDSIFINLMGLPGQGDVQCFFQKKDDPEAAKVQKGQKVTVRG